MINHPRVCAWLHLLSGVALIVALSLVLAVAASGYSGSGLAPGLKSLLGTVGLVVGTALCVVAGVELVGAAASLAGKPIGRPLLLLSAAFHVINVPLGTALGVYTFWALLRRGAPASSGTPTGRAAPGPQRTPS
ncbi:MAG: hypothetical protein HY856_11360 [Burkholderiales bacterium]|nr:hypothetical protein [Burkholderiales bacterium]